jgi:hypothetical protein
LIAQYHLVAMLAVCSGCGGHDLSRSGAEGAEGVDATAILTLIGDGRGANPEFLYVSDATRLGNGTVVVADRFRPALLFFNPEGALVRSVGRRGAGPGEFESPGWFVPCATDSLFLWDLRLGRMTVADSEGRFVRQFSIPSSPYRLQCSPGGLVAVLDKPAVIERMDSEGRALRRYHAELWLADRTGSRERVVGRIDVGENRPLGRMTSMALADDRLYVGTAESSAVDVYDLNGQLLSTWGLDVEPQQPSAEDYETSIDAMLEGFFEPAFRRAMRADMLRIPRPELMPAYREVFADADGTLLVLISSPAAPNTVLRVFDRTGAGVADVRLPGRSKVLEAGSDYALTVEGADSVQRVVLYEFSLPRAR